MKVRKERRLVHRMARLIAPSSGNQTYFFQFRIVSFKDSPQIHWWPTDRAFRNVPRRAWNIANATVPKTVEYLAVKAGLIDDAITEFEVEI